MKKVLSIILVVTMALSFCVLNVSAEENIKVIIDITNVKFDVPPTIINGRTLVPLRAIFEALGATVEWDDATQTVTSEKDETKISLTINSNIMTVNGEEKTLDVPATLIDSRTLVPVRAISEAFGLTVGWDGDNSIVSILSNTDAFQMYSDAKGNNRVFAKSAEKTKESQGWFTYSVTTVYSADGKSTVVKSDEAQSYLDGGYYAYPVKTVYSADGTASVIAASEFDAYLANGYLAEKPVIEVEGEEGESDKIDYSVYGDASEEELTIIATANLLSRLEDNTKTQFTSIWGGYYEDEFIVVIDMKAVKFARLFQCDAVLRLEEDSTVTVLFSSMYGGWHLGIGFQHQWAKDLIPRKTELFKNYSTKEVREKIFELGLKK